MSSVILSFSNIDGSHSKPPNCPTIPSKAKKGPPKTPKSIVLGGLRHFWSGSAAVFLSFSPVPIRWGALWADLCTVGSEVAEEDPVGGGGAGSPGRGSGGGGGSGGGDAVLALEERLLAATAENEALQVDVRTCQRELKRLTAEKGSLEVHPAGRAAPGIFLIVVH